MSNREGRRASDEDIALVAKSESEIQAEASVFSFEVRSMTERVRDDDLSHAFIQAHLYLDHIVSRMIAEEVPFPRHLQLDRVGFSQKLQLVAALGLLHPDHIAAVKVINSIRNKISHQLDYVVGAADETRLRSSFGKEALREPDGNETSLPDVLRLVSVLIDQQRQQRAFDRLMRRRAVANARVVLDEIGPSD